MIPSPAHPRLGLRGRQVDVAGAMAANGGVGYLLDDVRPGVRSIARDLHPRAFELAAQMPVHFDAVRELDALSPRKERHWRSYFRAPANDQGPTPRCTAFGALTAVHCLALSHRPIPRVSPATYYAMNQANDLRRGLDFRASGGGATTLAAAETAVQLGLAGAFWWTYTAGTALDTLVADGATLNGTDWPEGLFETDREGIARIRNGPTSAGGHLWAARGYLPRRDLVILAQTWGALRDFDIPGLGRDEMLISGDDYRELIEAREGEVISLRELENDRFVAPGVTPTFGIPSE